MRFSYLPLYLPGEGKGAKLTSHITLAKFPYQVLSNPQTGVQTLVKLKQIYF